MAVVALLSLKSWVPFLWRENGRSNRHRQHQVSREFA